MATETTDRKEFWNTALDTPFGVIAVKKRGMTMQQRFDDDHGHGLLVHPVVPRGPVATLALEQTMRSFDGTVIVRGHGWLDLEVFVWKGTAAEFIRTWEID